MDVRFINPFISSTSSVLKVMAGIEARRGVPFVKGSLQGLADVSGIIALAGETTGAVVVSFPLPLVRRIFESMTGEPIGEDDPEISDVVGEIANMVAGGAKELLSVLGVDFHVAVPNVVAGKNHSIVTRSKVPCLVIPFEVGPDTFWVQVSFQYSPQLAA